MRTDNYARRASAHLDDEVIEFIDATIRKSGYPPSVREIADHIGRSINATHIRIRHLIAEGRLADTPGRNRTLRVVTSAPDPFVIEHIVDGERWECDVHPIRRIPDDDE